MRARTVPRHEPAFRADPGKRPADPGTWSRDSGTAKADTEAHDDRPGARRRPRRARRDRGLRRRRAHDRRRVVVAAGPRCLRRDELGHGGRLRGLRGGHRVAPPALPDRVALSRGRARARHDGDGRPAPAGPARRRRPARAPAAGRDGVRLVVAVVDRAVPAAGAGALSRRQAAEPPLAPGRARPGRDCTAVRPRTRDQPRAARPRRAAGVPDAGGPRLTESTVDDLGGADGRRPGAGGRGADGAVPAR